MFKVKLKALSGARVMSVPDQADQRAFWSGWNAKYRGAEQVAHFDAETIRRRDTVLGWVRELGLHRPRILDVGCANGWLTARLAEFGEVMGTDIADGSIAVARERYPQIPFECGDFSSPDLRLGMFDMVVSLDVLGCVADQNAFIKGIRQVLRPSGYLILTTQNRFVFERRSDVAPQGVGQVRHWTSRGELRRLLRNDFVIRRFTTLAPEGHLGILRLVNSYKLNGLLERIVSRTAIERAKERLGFGHAIAVLAQRR
jgi:2-polyprenyl-3-methyl-5-hydroxy-6-metoxy-1,4-benzoquinol methylase